MNNNMMKVIVAVLVVLLTVSACGGFAVTPVPASQINVPTAAPAATEAPAATPEPPHEIYAGFTDNNAIPFLIIHPSGENLAVTQDVNSTNVTGLIWNSADGNSIVVYSDNSGRPTSAVVGEDIILYSNYTNETVDLTVIQADGTRSMFRSKLDTDLLNKITAFAPPSDSLVAYSIPNSGRLEPLDKWFWMKTGMYMLGAATCTVGTYAAITTGAVLLPPVLYELGKACSGTILGTMIRVGTILDLDVGGLQSINNGLNMVKCANADPAACVNVYLTEAEKQEKMADTISSNPPPAPPTPTPTWVAPAQTGGDYTCGTIGLSQPFLYNQSMTVTPIFKPYGSNDPADWWEFHPLGVEVQSLNHQFVFFDALDGKNIRIWNPEFSGTFVYRIGSYEVVDSCGPVIQAPAAPRPVNTSQPTQAQISNEIFFAALRQTPGYSNKDNTIDLLANVPAGSIVQILGGPAQADGLNWWNVSWNGITGWMADHTGTGKTIMIFLP